MKFDFRCESFKRKFSLNLFVYNFVTHVYSLAERVALTKCLKQGPNLDLFPGLFFFCPL